MAISNVTLLHQLYLPVCVPSLRFSEEDISCSWEEVNLYIVNRNSLSVLRVEVETFSLSKSVNPNQTPPQTCRNRSTSLQGKSHQPGSPARAPEAFFEWNIFKLGLILALCLWKYVDTYSLALVLRVVSSTALGSIRIATLPWLRRSRVLMTTLLWARVLPSSLSSRLGHHSKAARLTWFGGGHSDIIKDGTLIFFWRVCRDLLSRVRMQITLPSVM